MMRSEAMSFSNRYFRLGTHALIVIGLIAMLYPLIWMVSSSFKPSEFIFNDISFWPSSFTFSHYSKGWAGLSGYSFGTFILNSLLLAGACIVANVVSCSMAAYSFARLEFKFKKVLFSIMLLTMMLPQHVIIIPQYIIFNKLDWINSYLPLIVPKLLAIETFFVFLMVQFMRGLPRELDQAATVDGCGPIQTVWRIILPLSTPAVVTTTIFTFVWTWNDFFSQLLYISNIKLYTVSLALRAFMDSEGPSAVGSLFAMSILTMVPVFVLFIAFQRLIVEGIATSGLKG